MTEAFADFEGMDFEGIDLGYIAVGRGGELLVFVCGGGLFSIFACYFSMFFFLLFFFRHLSLSHSPHLHSYNNKKPTLTPKIRLHRHFHVGNAMINIGRAEEITMLETRYVEHEAENLRMDTGDFGEPADARLPFGPLGDMEQLRAGPELDFDRPFEPANDVTLDLSVRAPSPAHQHARASAAGSLGGFPQLNTSLPEMEFPEGPGGMPDMMDIDLAPLQPAEAADELPGFGKLPMLSPNGATAATLKVFKLINGRGVC
jgi:hypothetical protein